jgi:hypothetical protein
MFGERNELVYHEGKVLGKHIPTTHFPLWMGMLGGYGFDLLAKLTRQKASPAPCATSSGSECLCAPARLFSSHHSPAPERNPLSGAWAFYGGKILQSVT